MSTPTVILYIKVKCQTLWEACERSRNPALTTLFCLNASWIVESLFRKAICLSSSTSRKSLCWWRSFKIHPLSMAFWQFDNYVWPWNHGNCSFTCGFVKILMSRSFSCCIFICSWLEALFLYFWFWASSLRG